MSKTTSTTKSGKPELTIEDFANQVRPSTEEKKELDDQNAAFSFAVTDTYEEDDGDYLSADDTDYPPEEISAPVEPTVTPKAPAAKSAASGNGVSPQNGGDTPKPKPLQKKKVTVKNPVPPVASSDAGEAKGEKKTNEKFDLLKDPSSPLYGMTDLQVREKLTQILKMRVVEARDSVWHGKVPLFGLSQISKLLRNIMGLSSAGDGFRHVMMRQYYDSETPEDVENSELGSYLWNYEAFDVERKASKAPKAPQVKKEKVKSEIPANPIFMTVQNSTGQANAALLNNFKHRSDKEIEAFIALTDSLAFVTSAPAKAVAALGNKSGGIRKNLSPSLKNEQIIEFCCSPTKMRGIVQTRFPNASEAYRIFLQTISTSEGRPTGALNWSWETLCNFFVQNYRELVEGVVAAATHALEGQKSELKAGAYGPFFWRVRTDELLKIHLSLARTLRQEFIAKKDNTKIDATSVKNNTNAKYLNIPLCGTDCFSYMTQEQIKVRLNLGVPWAKFAKEPVEIETVVPRSLVGKIINKSSAEYRKFLAAQKRALRPSQTAPRSAKGLSRTAASYTVDDWN